MNDIKKGIFIGLGFSLGNIGLNVLINFVITLINQ